MSDLHADAIALITEFRSEGNNAIAEALAEALDDPELLQELLGEGVQESQEFSPEFARTLLESGFSGTIQDKAGHKRTYVDGKQVANQPDASSQPKLTDQIDKAPTQDLTPEQVAQQKRDAKAAVDWEATARTVKARTPSKELQAAMKYRDVARRRRVIKAVKNEGELADAIQGYNLPDSEPADVIHVLDAAGKPIRDRAVIKHVLAQREAFIKELNNPKTDPERKKVIQHFLERQQVHFFEVKTLLTSRNSTVHMNAAAIKRKDRWAAKYGASFHTVAIDDRKGSKHSGHRVYIAPGELGQTTHLKHMKKAGTMADVLSHAYGKAGES